MPGRPAKVAKLKNQTAKPAGLPSHSAISQNRIGLLPNRPAAISFSVATTSCVSFSYSASSQSSEKISPLSSGRARWIESAIRRSHRDFGLDVRMRVVADELKILVTEGEDVLHVRIDLHHR